MLRHTGSILLAALSVGGLAGCRSDQLAPPGEGGATTAATPVARTPGLPFSAGSGPDSGLTLVVDPAQFANLANTAPATQWFYFRDGRNGVWYIANLQGQVYALDAIGPSYLGGIGWQPINLGTTAGYPSAGANFASVTVSDDGRSVTIGAATQSGLPSRAAALENTVQSVAWLFFQDSAASWYIARADSAVQVLMLADTSASAQGELGWQPVYNATFGGYPSAGQTFTNVSVGSGGRSTVFGAAAAVRLVAIPDSIELAPGESTQGSIQALDALGRNTTVPPLTWTSLTTGITVTGAGLVSASGSITSDIPDGIVQASSGSLVAQLRVAVMTPQPTASLSASPASISSGQSTTLTWSSTSTSSCAGSWTGTTLPPSGTQTVTPLATTTFSVTCQGISANATASATVTVGAASDNGYVQIRWVGTEPDASIVAAFEAARERINGLFNSFAGVTSVSVNLPANYCITGEPATNEAVPGIVLYVEVGPIDGVGGILGSAGPCVLRTSSLLPAVGVMNFDQADMDNMIATGLLNGVVLHEMMHTLGFGTIWGPGDLNLVPAINGSDPRYLGPAGMAAYAALGAANAALGVAVENTGGSGTRGSHWRESVFDSELMTGWANGAMEMSAVTVSALKDFGYDVDISKADPYHLPNPSGASLIQAGRPINEVLIEPKSTIGISGQLVPWHRTTGH